MIRVERVLVMELDDSLERLISSGAEEVEGKEQQLLAHSFCWSPSYSSWTGELLATDELWTGGSIWWAGESEDAFLEDVAAGGG